MVRRGWAPLVKFSAWHCTANLSSYLCNRRALDDACQFLLGITLDKSTRDDANGKTSDQLRADPAEWERMLAYARSDAFHCWSLWDKFGHLWPEHERQLSNLTIEQGMRGVQIDVELLNEYLRVTDTMMIVALHSLPWMDAPGAKPTSPKAMAEACRKAGIPCPPVKSREGVDAFDAWETKYAPQFPWIQGVIAYRQLNKFHGTLKTIKTRLKDDGTLPFGLKYFGAHTGRWSGDAGLNFQNFRKVPIYATEAGALTEDKNLAAHTLDVRRLIIPRPDAV
jgi:DNA polymerase I-like protein with 3'-5' exonuclease and polymerase domains